MLIKLKIKTLMEAFTLVQERKYFLLNKFTFINLKVLAFSSLKQVY